MTGYGKAQSTSETMLITVQIRTLNSKQCDLSIKLPQEFRDKEQEIRQWVSKELVRGKIDVLITAENHAGEGNYTIDHEKALKYHESLTELSKKAQINTPDLLGLIVKMPDVVTPARNELSEDEWNVLKTVLQSALSNCIDFRKKEGAALESKLIEHARIISEKSEEITPFETERISYQRDKILKELDKLSYNPKYDPARLEEEMVYYLEKADITEEKVRLAQHLKYFNQNITEANHNGIGKKLNFIAQEIGREINTLGNKAAHFEIQKLVVEMKDELEKIKEQVLNIL